MSMLITLNLAAEPALRDKAVASAITIGSVACARLTSPVRAAGVQRFANGT